MVKLFLKGDCPTCSDWRRKLETLRIPFQFYNVDTAEGLAEMALSGITDTPGLLIGTKKFSNVVASGFGDDELLRLCYLESISGVPERWFESWSIYKDDGTSIHGSGKPGDAGGAVKGEL